MDLENFIEKSKKIHGDRFDYSKFKYNGSKNKSILICNRCNIEFLTTPSNNLIGKDCKNCYEIKRSINIISFNLKKKYNWSFNFNNYKNSDSIIEYVCDNNHKGESNYRNMIRFNVCKECNKLELIKVKSEKIIKNNLEITEYVNDNLIKCKCIRCGYIREDTLINLTYNNYKCKYCILLLESKLIKENKLKLLKIDGSKLHLECSKGHKYKQDRSNLLSNRGCNECRKEKIIFTREYVFNKFNEIHGDLYKYKYDDYISLSKKIEITCRRGHIFKQKASNHLQGKGCPICRESVGERTMSVYFENKDINFIRQKKFPDCKYISHLPFDFYIPQFNMIIEYDGIQHYEPVELFGGIDEFEKTKIKDKIKNEYCLKNNILLYRISYKDDIINVLDLIFN